VDGEPVSTDRRKAVALLAYLAMTGRAHARESLATLFWPEYDGSRALTYLRRTIWEIQRLVGEGVLEVTRRDVALTQDADIWLDVALFRRQVAQGDSSGDLNPIVKGVELYRDDFLAGFTLRDSPDFDDWQRLQAEILRMELARALACLAEGLGTAGQFDDALDYAHRWLTLDHLHEPAHRQLMRLYAAAGNRSAALRQYECCVQILLEELGVEPEPETTALAQDIRQSTQERSARALVPTGDKAAPASSLPRPATPFVGRQAELEQIDSLLRTPHCRLLTLVGPGGIGKTRLALEAAARQEQVFHDGIVFIPLTTLESPEQIVPAVTKALDLHILGEGGNHRQQLFDRLRSRRMLLLMDNFEHLLREGGGAFAGDLLAAAPQVKILATSRARLNLQAEQVMAVGGLEVPTYPALATPEQLAEAGTLSAVQLFLQSARRVRPNLNQDPTSLQAIADICRLVQGVPLAIEMAAGWMGMLAPGEILAELQHNLDLLQSTHADMPVRQRSMRAVFDWTWNLLTPTEQEVFQQLAIFRGQFSRQAAQRITGVTLPDLLGLVNKSLLLRIDQGYFELHELLRQFAARRLEAQPVQWQAARERYHDYYLAWLAEQGPVMRGPDQKQAFDALEAQRENLRNAWLWAVEDGHHDEANRVMGDLLLYLDARETRPEIDSLARASLEALSGEQESLDGRLLRVKLLIVKAWALVYDWNSTMALEVAESAWQAMTQWGLQGQLGLMAGLLGWVLDVRSESEQGIAMLEHTVRDLREQGPPWDLAMALNWLSEMLLWRNHSSTATTTEPAFDEDRVRQLINESIEISRQLGDQLQRAQALLTLGTLEMRVQENEDMANAILLRSHALFAAVGDRAAAAEALYQIGISNQRVGASEAAIRAFLTGYRMIRELGETSRAADMVAWASISARQAGDYTRARQLREEALAVYEVAEDTHGIAWSHWELGEISRLSGRARQARQEFAESMRLFEAHEILRGKCFYHRSVGSLALAEGDDEAATAHFRDMLGLAEAERYGWGISQAYSFLGKIALGSGQVDVARQHFGLALRHGAAFGELRLMLRALAGIAGYQAASGELDQAVELAAFVNHHRATPIDTREEMAVLLARVATKLPEDRYQAAISRGMNSDLGELISQTLKSPTE
jgi:predicted ATPase/DNA-binding SARP family transcriptional activator